MAPLTCESGVRFSAHGPRKGCRGRKARASARMRTVFLGTACDLVYGNPRLGSDPRQEPPEVVCPERHAARGRMTLRPRDVDEHRAPPTRLPRTGVVVELNQEVVE